MFKTAPIALVALALTGAALRSEDTTAPAAPAGVDPEAFRQIELLMRGMEIAREQFVEPEAVTYERLVEAALDGLYARLDEHSGFISPRLLEEMRDAGENPDNAAGITVSIRAGDASLGLAVAALAEAGPAARAGVKVGDLLLAIDGTPTAGLGVPGAHGRLDGAPGTLVTVEVQTPGAAAPRTLGFQREQPHRETVVGARLLPADLAGDGPPIGYARVSQFRATTPRELRDTLAALEGEGAAAFVLDLRGNPGGALEAAVETCALFLPPGSPVVSTRGREGTDNNAELKTPELGPAPRTDPLALLVDGQSASSAEVLTGALRDHGRALVAGERTFGKGSVQSVISLGLDSGAAVRLTTARFFTPKGHAIEGVGIEPDLALGEGDTPIAAAARALRGR